MISSRPPNGVGFGRACRLIACSFAAILPAIAFPAAAEPNWSAAKGERLNLMLISHPFVESLKPLLPEFTAKTGIKVTYEELAEQSGFEKLLADLSSKTGGYDVFMTSPLNNWQYSAAGWIEPLDPWLTNASKTAANYDPDDFIPSILAAGRWNLERMKGVGEGKLWALPINFESYQLAYRPSLLKRLGLEVPKTYADLIKIADQLKLDDKNGKIYGVITRFDRYWDLPYLTFGTMLQSYGAEMVDSGGNLQVCSSKSIEATQDFITLIKKASPEGAGAFTWYEAMQGFASGQYVFSFNEANLFAPTYEDPKQSAISQDVGYAPTLLGPGGQRAASVWIWSLSMNAASAHKEAAWLFLQWVTSKETMIKTHLAGNMNPVRKSAWDAPEVTRMMQSWGEYPNQYLEAAKIEAEVAAIRFPPHPELTRMLDRWAEAIQKTYFGQGDAKTNLCEAQADIQKMLNE